VRGPYFIAAGRPNTSANAQRTRTRARSGAGREREVPGRRAEAGREDLGGRRVLEHLPDERASGCGSRERGYKEHMEENESGKGGSFAASDVRDARDARDEVRAPFLSGHLFFGICFWWKLGGARVRSCSHPAPTWHRALIFELLSIARVQLHRRG